MAVVIPQVITEDRAAAQSVATGSFVFPDSVGHHKLTLYPQNGNQNTYTVSMWVKNSMPDAIGQNPLWSASPPTDNNNYYGLYLGSDQLRYHNGNPSTTDINGSNKLRDPNSWYHIHTKVDSNTAQAYINGEAWGSSFTLDQGWWNNGNYVMDIGSQAISGGVTGAVYAGYQFAQVYNIDGQALGPEYFGHTDPLTGVWSPKKADIQADSAAYSYNIYSTSDNGSGAPSDLNTTSKTNITFATNGFDGNSATFCVNSDSSNTGWTVFRPASPISVSSSLVIRCTRTGQIWLNGADSGVDNDQNLVQDITVPLNGATSITSIALQNSATVGSANRFAQIIVDGTVLTDPVTWGTNGFYLPMDGKTPVNEDQSPNGLNFYTTYYTTTAATASGSLSPFVTLDKATGAIPILKTDPSGQVMSGGVRTHKITYKVTVVNDGGNKYFLNGVRYSPGTIPMYRGGVYEFDQSDSSNATHPLRFATAADAAGSTQYTDGVQQNGTPGQSGAYTRITVPHNAPDTLYYYCTNHGGMGGPTANTTDIHVADPYAWKCVLAVPFNDFNDGSLYYGIQNYCHTGRPDCINPYGGAETYITPYNSVLNQGYQFNYYGGSRTFDGNGDYMLFQSYQTTEAGDALAFGTGDFTVEFWANFEDMGADSSSAVLSTSTTSMNAGSWIIGFHGSAGSASFGWCYDVNNFNWASTRIDGYFHSWHHYAFSRKSGEMKMFIDGVQMFKFTDKTNYNYVAADGKIGQRWINQDAYSLDGEIQDLRVYKGVAKYGDNTNYNRDPAFLCGSVKPYFLPEVPKGTPYPGTLKKIEGGSIHCMNQGTNANSYLEIANSSDFDFGTGDFTVECFFYVEEESGTNTAQCLISKSSTTFSTTTSSWWLRKAGDNDIQFGFISGGAYKTMQLDKNWGFESRSWTHVAATRKSGVVKIFLNGIQCGSSTSYGTDMTGTIDVTTEPLRIGSNGSSLGLFKGYISNVRIVKGTALYDTSFNAPTEPLEAVNNTVLLCCQSATSATEAAVSPGDISAYKAPAGFSYWTAGYDTGWSVNSTKTSHTGTGSGDYIPSVLPSSGKHYWETVVRNVGTYRVIGVTDDGGNAVGNTGYQDNMSGFYYNGSPPIFLTKKASGTSTADSVTHGSSTGTGWNEGDILMWAYDGDNGKLWLGLNGTWYASGNPETGSNSTHQNLNTSGSYFKTAYYNGGGSLTVEILSSDVRKPGPSNFTPFINNLLQMQGPENNYAVLEASKIKTNTGEINDGGLSFHGATSSAWNTFPATMGASSGKWYWEIYVKTTAIGNVRPGALQDGSFHTWDTDVYLGQASYGNSFAIAQDGRLRRNLDGVNSDIIRYKMPWGPNDETRCIVSWALDMDNGKAYVAINGVWGTVTVPATNGMISDGTAVPAVSGLTGTWRPALSVNGGTYNWDTIDVNFGQRPFRYAPPEGYKCWNRTNLPAPEKAARNANKNFDVVTWTGDGTSPRTINTEFQPDFVWVKSRSHINSNTLYDSVRGFGANKELVSDSTTFEGNTSNPATQNNGYVSGVTESGFTVTAGAGGEALTNTSGRTYVAWCWKAGGAAVTNNDGSITSQVSANTDAGFSIVSYNGTGSNGTIGHGLTQAPEFVIYKRREATINWVVYHKDLPNPATEYLELNSTSGPISQANMFNSTQPTDSVLSIGTDTHINVTPTEPFIAYCWHSVEGYCKVGSYIANGNANGPVIYTDFEPAWIMIKYSSTKNWLIYDLTRQVNNPDDKALFANLDANESSGTYYIDKLSNGFKIRNADSNLNYGGATYYYVALAEAPTNAGFGAVVNAR